MSLYKKLLGHLKKEARLGNDDAKKQLNELGVAQHTVNSKATGNIREKLQECLTLTFEHHDFQSAQTLAATLIRDGVEDIVPWICLSAIFGTAEDWENCAYTSRKALEFDGNHPMMLNHIGVSLCHQDDVHGLYYLKLGMINGDHACRENYNFWNSHFKID